MGQEFSPQACGRPDGHPARSEGDCPFGSMRYNFAGASPAPLSIALAVSPRAKRVKKDLRLARAILEIGANLPDIDDIKVEEIGISDIGEEIVLEGLPQTDEVDGDESRTRALDLAIGDWLELIDEQHNRRRIKLCWKSLVTSLYVFVNLKGIKVAAIHIDDLGDRLRQGTARII